MNFNSHAHVERDHHRLFSFQLFFISTHTLTWSVTRLFLAVKNLVSISTHTLTWSVTGTKGNSWRNYKFQLTRSRGAWQDRHRTFWQFQYFNSHAHVERDFCGIHTAKRFNYFNSHAHVERDSLSSSASISPRISTHTLTWSVTFSVCHLYDYFRISTHTLTWSVTL